MFEELSGVSRFGEGISDNIVNRNSKRENLFEKEGYGKLHELENLL